MHRLSFSADDELYSQIIEVAKKNHVNVSNAIRMLISKGIKCKE